MWIAGFLAALLPGQSFALVSKPSQESVAHVPNVPEMRGIVTDIFKSGSVYVYRIPALIVLDGGSQKRQPSQNEVILAFAERRKNTLDLAKNTSKDTGDIDVVARRSEDSGRSWSEEVVVCDFGVDVCGNPTAVEDVKGRVHLLLTRNPADSGEESDHVQRTVWASRSSDQGRTWEDPRNITTSTKQASWSWYATGPGHVTRLRHQKDPRRNGRLIVSADHSERTGGDGKHQYESHVILSDDDGETWRLGGKISQGPGDQSNEATIVEREDGTLLLNARNFVHASAARLLTKSGDGGVSWDLEQKHDDLVTPDCQGAMHILKGPSEGGHVSAKETILFSHPYFTHESSWERKGLKISMSNDGGRTWPSKKEILVHDGSSGYSDLGALNDGTMLVMYEKGMEGITLQSLLWNSPSVEAGGHFALHSILLLLGCLILIATIVEEQRFGFLQSFGRRHIPVYELQEKVGLRKLSGEGGARPSIIGKLASALPWPVQKALGIAEQGTSAAWTL